MKEKATCPLESTPEGVERMVWLEKSVVEISTSWLVPWFMHQIMGEEGVRAHPESSPELKEVV